MKLEEIGKKKFLGKGNMSKCYLLEDGNVLKLFNSRRSIDEIGRFKYFLKYDNDSFVFPFEFIYDSKYFYGYITKFAKGINIEDAFPKSNLLGLANNSIKLEKDIDFVSEGGITLYDFHDNNLLYDGKKYSAIDHDESGILRNTNYVKLQNRETHRLMIIRLFENNIEKNRHTNFILDKISKYEYMHIYPSEMIVQIKDDIERYYKEKIETVEDVNNIIRR